MNVQEYVWGWNQEAPAAGYCSSFAAKPGVQRAETEDARGAYSGQIAENDWNYKET